MQNFWEFSTGAKILLAICAVVLIVEGLYINYVMGGKVASVIATETSCERVLQKWEKDNPERASKRAQYTGKAAAVNYETTNIKQAANFKSSIDEAVSKGSNFAGKFAVAQWGCGSQCQGHAVVNVESGKIIAFGPQTEAGIGISPDSPVLITNPKENFPSIADMQKADLVTLTSLANIPREYYVLVGENDDAGLQKICTENPFEGIAI